MEVRFLANCEVEVFILICEKRIIPSYPVESQFSVDKSSSSSTAVSRSGRELTMFACSPQNLFPSDTIILQKRFFFSKKKPHLP